MVHYKLIINLLKTLLELPEPLRVLELWKALHSRSDFALNRRGDTFV